MSKPIFNDYKDENLALEAVQKMKAKYSSTCIYVINPQPLDYQKMGSEEYGLPEKNVNYGKSQHEFQSRLIECGFKAQEVTQMEREIEPGTILVIVCA
ncbi:hypothetical protein [Geomicrobium sp. JCM 19055]|uniref:hypothetical protein n=1 Tax=Geomicrobium sp. JCM 19055 TaxID=1460649 RepID=UPI0005A9331E|nr:hypothetical protein [Geomicrobium sp. JCM 19055]